MTQRTKREAVKAFIRDYRIARTRLSLGIPIKIGSFPGLEITSEAQFHKWFTDRLDAKINRLGGIDEARATFINNGRRPWRKLEYAFQADSVRDQYRLIDIRTRRIRVYQFETAEVRKRFSHLLSNRSEE